MPCILGVESQTHCLKCGKPGKASRDPTCLCSDEPVTVHGASCIHCLSCFPTYFPGNKEPQGPLTATSVLLCYPPPNALEVERGRIYEPNTLSLWAGGILGCLRKQQIFPGFPSPGMSQYYLLCCMGLEARWFPSLPSSREISPQISRDLAVGHPSLP